MTTTEIRAMYPKMKLIFCSQFDDEVITTAVEETGNGFYIVTFATQSGKILSIKGKGNGKSAYKRFPRKFKL
jgi:hypothetical protein